MSSPGSCFRCSKAQALLSPSGLCEDCAATDATADPTPAESPAPELDSAGATVTDVPRATPAEGSTATPPGSATASAPAPGAPVLPEAPPGFTLVRHLGGGGMGDVYLAREWPAGRDVALKFLKRHESPAAFQRFVTELQVLAELDHPNVVGVLASDFQRSTPFFTMARADGGSLADALQAGLPAPDEAVRIIRVIAGAVAAAHAKDIVHRDLKPNNVLLFGPPGEWHRLKVADFGLAKRLGDEDGFTATEDALGTPGYMPPEQVSRANGADGKIDCRADVYGLGATLYHLLTGRAPFVGPTKLDIIAQVLADAPERPRKLRPEVSLALEAIVLKCLAKDPAERYPSVAAFQAALDSYERLGHDPGAPQMTWWRRAMLWAKRNRRGIGAAALAPLSVALAFALGAAPWRPSANATMSTERGSEPPDPVAEMWKELATGRETALIAEQGLPKYHRGLLEPTTLGLSPMGDGTCAFHAFDTCLLELCPDPCHSRYRVSMDLRHLRPLNAQPGAVDTDYIGVYFGFGAGARPPRTAYATLSVTFEDYPAKPNAPDRQRAVWLRRLGFTQGGNVWTKEDSGKLKALRFNPTAVRPGKWRRIVIDVAHDEVVVQWCPEPDKAPEKKELLVRWSGDEVQAQYAALKKALDVHAPGVAGAIPAWSPRMPFGVVSFRSSVSLKNVILTPLS